MNLDVGAMVFTAPIGGRMIMSVSWLHFSFLILPRSVWSYNRWCASLLAVRSKRAIYNTIFNMMAGFSDNIRCCQ